MATHAKTCRRCGKEVGPKDFCLTNFPHAQFPDEGMTHVFWHCTRCRRRVGSPIPRHLMVEAGVNGAAVPFYHARKSSKPSP